MCDTGKRLLTVQPGDYLLVGHLGTIGPEQARQLSTMLRELLGVAGVIAFAGEIDLEAVPAAVARAYADASEEPA